MITAIIIDDEPLMCRRLEEMIRRYTTEVEIVGIGATVNDAIGLINEHSPDLAFLDIELAGETVFDLFNNFDKHQFGVIFITAFDQYAVKAFRYAAVDYLLKPLAIDQLKEAVQRFRQNHERKTDARLETLLGNMNTAEKQNQKLALPSKDGYVFVRIRDIIRFEGIGPMTHVYLADGQHHQIHKHLRSFDELLSDTRFFRIHKSHLVNLHQVSKYSRTPGNTVTMSDGSVVEISMRKRGEFRRMLHNVDQ